MKKSELRELVREQVRNLIKEANISQEAYTIHNITKCGQDAAQNFIDDNKLDGKKLAAYVRQHSNSKEKYEVRDIIAGTGVGANVSFKARFLKQFKESVIKEAKEYTFTFDYNTDPDDIEYIENLLKKARVNAYAEQGTFDDEMVIKAGDAIELRKAKKAIEADGFQINEASLKEANELSSYKIGDQIKFSNGEIWKVAKPGVKGDKIFLAPFNSIAKKGHISLAIEFSQDELNDTVTESINEAANDISYINKARAKSSLEQIKKGKRSDGMGKFDAKVYAIKGTQEIELTDPSDLAKYSTGYKYGLKSESINEALIGPFAISNSTPDDELIAMYHGALDGYANYKPGMKFKKSDYKLAYQTIEKILQKKGVAITEADDPEAGEAAPYGSGYSEVNEDAGMVIDVAMGVAVGLMGLWALVQSAPLVGRVFGDAAEYLANKSEKKAKLALKNQRKETIAPIIAKFKNDKQLADMYQNLTPYSAAAKLGSSQAGLKAQQGRVNQLTKIGKYIKSKLTPEELVYFRDISAMLRDGDLK